MVVGVCPPVGVALPDSKRNAVEGGREAVSVFRVLNREIWSPGKRFFVCLEIFVSFFIAGFITNMINTQN